MTRQRDPRPARPQTRQRNHQWFLAGLLWASAATISAFGLLGRPSRDQAPPPLAAGIVEATSEPVVTTGPPATGVRLAPGQPAVLTEMAPPSDTPEPSVTLTPAESPTPTLSPTPSLTPTPPPEAALPVLPRIDAGMKDRLRAVHGLGLERGMRPEVFAKVGDSITISGFFLTDVGCGRARLGEHGNLAPVIDYFRQVTFPAQPTAARCDEVNAFTRLSRSARKGWLAGQVLTTYDPPVAECPAPDDTPLRCELRLAKPGIALVMLGTNDVAMRTSSGHYRSVLDRIVTDLTDAGVVPVLSTIPQFVRYGAPDPRVHIYNGAVVDVARERQVPLWNYWRALQGPEMVRGGLEPDGVHPNTYSYGVAFTPEGLRYGYNQRNLTALQVLAKVKRIVLEDGPPDG